MYEHLWLNHPKYMFLYTEKNIKEFQTIDMKKHVYLQRNTALQKRSKY